MNAHKLLLVDDPFVSRTILPGVLKDGFEHLETEDGLQTINISERTIHDISFSEKGRKTNDTPRMLSVPGRQL